jgi:MYXO-CTERM domain-containing protein
MSPVHLLWRAKRISHERRVLVVLGSLPTQAGLVWIDVGFSDKGLGYDTVTFEAFDAGGTSLGSVDLDVGDGDFRGQTAEDRFFGATDDAGISRITLTSHFSSDWEIDHLQYGCQPPAVPAPGALLLAVVGALLTRFRRRRDS